jgi:hypothetical protein
MAKTERPMSSRQCEIAAESYVTCLLAQSAYDVFVQYGAHQQDFDLVATKDERTLRISVKGTQDGAWMLAVKYLQPGVGYIEAIKKWLKAQPEDLVYMFVSFRVPHGEAPRVYVAGPPEIAEQLESQSSGQGKAVLREDTPAHHPRAKHQDKIPNSWHYSTERLDNMYNPATH